MSLLAVTLVGIKLADMLRVTPVTNTIDVNLNFSCRNTQCSELSKFIVFELNGFKLCYIFYAIATVLCNSNA